MSTFNFSDITIAGAYSDAINAANKSDRRNADRPSDKGENRKTMKGFRTLIQTIAAIIVEKRPTSAPLGRT